MSVGLVISFDPCKPKENVILKLFWNLERHLMAVILHLRISANLVVLQLVSDYLWLLLN